MPVTAKICGLSTPEAIAAAAAGGARAVGFVFYPRSPRAVDAPTARGLAAGIPPGVERVGLVVDMTDDDLAAIVARVPLDLLQLHGGETPKRVQAIKRRFGLPVMKAISVADADDVARARDYLGVADRLLFDAKPPKTLANALPGGNAVSFDWRLLAGRDWPLPWMLSGGLDPDNVGEAIRIAGARAVDVSSGVERRPGVKEPDKIAAFLRAVAAAA